MNKACAADEDSETEKEEKIKFDVEGFFKELDAPEGINMLQKQDMCNARVFMKIPYETLEKTLEIKPSGKKVKVMKRVKEQREKFEKEGYIEYVKTHIEMPDLNISKSMKNK